MVVNELDNCTYFSNYILVTSEKFWHKIDNIPCENNNHMTKFSITDDSFAFLLSNNFSMFVMDLRNDNFNLIEILPNQVSSHQIEGITAVDQNSTYFWSSSPNGNYTFGRILLHVNSNQIIGGNRPANKFSDIVRCFSNNNPTYARDYDNQISSSDYKQLINTYKDFEDYNSYEALTGTWMTESTHGKYFGNPKGQKLICKTDDLVLGYGENGQYVIRGKLNLNDGAEWSHYLEEGYELVGFT